MGQLLGIKTFINTMVAYFKFPSVEHTMSPRSKMIATYALCGFSNPASIGITIGATKLHSQISALLTFQASV